MRRALLVTLVFAMVPFRSAGASHTFATPSTNLLFQLEKQNRRSPWLHVTTDSARFTLKASRIDELGLHGLTPPRDAQLSSDALRWSQVGRIDEVVTRAQRGRVMGSIVLGLAGAGLGNALGAPKVTEMNSGRDATSRARWT